MAPLRLMIGGTGGFDKIDCVGGAGGVSSKSRLVRPALTIGSALPVGSVVPVSL